MFIKKYFFISQKLFYRNLHTFYTVYITSSKVCDLITVSVAQYDVSKTTIISSRAHIRFYSVKIQIIVVLIAPLSNAQYQLRPKYNILIEHTLISKIKSLEL